MKTQIYDKINLIGEDVQIEVTLPQVRTQFSAQILKSEGEINKDLSLFVPGQALELGEILARSARGMTIPIVTREGVYISKSIDDEIDVLDKFDKDLTDYSKALLKYRREQEMRHAKELEKAKKKDELYNEWVKSLSIKKDITENAE